MVVHKIWNELTWLESQDAVGQTYRRLHNRDLNLRRRMEITASARQAREYFSNATNSDISVRPLLTFYGVSSLSRACILLTGTHGGEASLVAAHGLETVRWGETLDGDLKKALSSIGTLKIRTCRGLYMDLVKHTDNMICVHINSSEVQWNLKYPAPKLGDETDFDNLTSRFPDLQAEVIRTGRSVKFIHVNEMTYDSEKGFEASLQERSPSDILSLYAKSDYSIETTAQQHNLAVTPQVFDQLHAQLVHAYKRNSFGIPDLHIAEPLWGGSSQICMTFKISYILGMLSRYYPTHWIALMNGTKGDLYRALLLQSQNVVERTFPELICELINYKSG